MENVGRDDGTGRKIPAMVVLTGTQGKQADAEGSTNTKSRDLGSARLELGDERHWELQF